MFRDGLLDGRRIAVVAPTHAARPALAPRLTGLGAVLAEEGALDALVVDAAAGSEDLVAWSAAVWRRVRPAVGAPGAAVVLIAPPTGEAPRAALENLARTLSIEWARFAIRPTCIAPGPSVADAQLADLVAYLVSPAGAYFSGCRLDLA